MRAALLLCLAACGGADEAVIIADARPPDAVPVDAAPVDAGIFVPPDAPDDDSGIAYLPDLVPVADQMGNYTIVDQTFEAEDAAVIEGCVGGTGARRLLRFDTVTGNLGDADLYAGVPSADNPIFTWSPAHGHYHVEGFAEYTLHDPDGALVTGHKQAFCLMDSVVIEAGAVRKYACNNQGITRGCADVYNRYLECQWIDITGVAPGTYTLRVTLNPEGLIEEQDLTNNVWERDVSL